MEFLNRFNELQRLDRLVERGASGLVAIWGRRRVGKTRLLVEWSERAGGVYTVADQSSAPVQRRYFAEALAGKLPGFEEASYSDWDSLLNRLSRDARLLGWKGPLILDEFPYLVLSAPELPSILQRWIDRETREDGLLVAIAGSSQQMMQGMVLSSDAPLYGRALEAMALAPMDPTWIFPALGLDDPLDALKAFAIWGGIPRYWELARPFGRDLAGAVDALVLDPQGPLHREPDRLLHEELPSATALRPLLDVIGNGVHRLSEIAGRLGQPATSLARPLARLCELGLIDREIPHGSPEKSGKRSLYRIQDPFFRFWFRVIAPHRAALVASSAKSRRLLFHRHAGRLFAESWEALCLRAANRGEQIGREPFSDVASYRARRWWHGNAPEWDVVATPDPPGHWVVGEAKWSEEPFDLRELERIATSLLHRALPPGVEGDVQRVLFVPKIKSEKSITTSGVHLMDSRAILLESLNLETESAP